MFTNWDRSVIVSVYTDGYGEKHLVVGENDEGDNLLTDERQRVATCLLSRLQDDRLINDEGDEEVPF